MVLRSSCRVWRLPAILLIFGIKLQHGSVFSFSPGAATRFTFKERGSHHHHRRVCNREFSGVTIDGNIRPKPYIAGVAGSSWSREANRADLGAESGAGDRQAQPVVQESSSRQPQHEGFEWSRQWYPIAVVRDLEAMDPREPFPVKLLGQSIVVWKNPKDGQWKAFPDRCPHRWAPLSEGRVDQATGRLQCIYHGWEFEGDGKCGAIPQADPAVRESAQNSRRACAEVLPTTVVQDLLWLWPDSSPERVAASGQKSPAVVPDMSDDSFNGSWYMRDLEYGYDTLVENLSDPAHIPFAHHGVIGNRKMASALGITMEQGSGRDELKTSAKGFSGQRNLRVGFEAPSLVYYENEYSDMLPRMLKKIPAPYRLLGKVVNKIKGDNKIELALKGEGKDDPSNRLMNYFVSYAVPTQPGKSRIFIRNARNFILKPSFLPRKWTSNLAKEHLGQHLVLDGDSMALHVQERELLDFGKHGGADAERTFFMPTDADTTVRSFRKWYNSRGGGGPSWAKGVNPLKLGPVLPREQALDRLHSHTRHCSACSKAYRGCGKVKHASVVGAVLLLATTVAAPPGLGALCCAIGALAISGFAVTMDKRQQEFVFVDYKHAIRDG